jgi:membrane fusion protein (multidrug efflux system)
MPNSKTKIAGKLLVVLACSCSMLAAVLGVSGCTAAATPERVNPPSVTVVESKRMTVPIIVHPIGTSRALEEVTIRARVRGFLTERHFEYGSSVKKGQLLLVIDKKPFQVALEQAKAVLLAVNAALEKAQASKAVEVAAANLALDHAQLRLDEVEERRERILLARKAASQEDYDKAEAQKKKSAAKADADQANLDQTKADFRIDIDSAKADVARAQANLDDAQINLGYCEMYAPIDGRIGELKVKVGNLVGDAGLTELVTIQQLDPMGLDLRPPARYIPEATALLGAGVNISLTVEGERRHPHTGKATFIDNTVDAQTSTFLLRAEVSNPSSTLLPGEFIRATMTVGEFVDAVVVPEKAVLEGQDGTRCFTVDSENKVGVAKVRALDSYRGLRVLESGIESGQRVIVDGTQLVRQGQTVLAQSAPFESFMTDELPDLPGDPRFNSPITRMPGRDAKAQNDPSANGRAGKSGSETGKPQAPLQKSPDSTTTPPQPTKSPAGKQPR